MTPTYITKINLKIWTINIGAQKINDLIFQIFNIILSSFWIRDKLEKVWFF